MLNKYKIIDYENRFRQAIFESIVIQFLWLIFGGIVLCSPESNPFLITLKVAFFSYWPLVGFILLRRHSRLQETDFQYIRFGIFLNGGLAFFFMVFYSLILQGIEKCG